MKGDQALATRYGSNALLATILSYIDRAAAFVCPLLVLKVLGNPHAYTEIEYILSLGIILATFFDGGLRSYLLFHARQLNSADAAIAASKAALTLLLIVYITALIVSYTLSSGFESQSYLICLAIARGSALAITGLLAQGLILTGKPALAPLPSIANWSLSCIVLVQPHLWRGTSPVPLFFSGSFALIFGTAAAMLSARPLVSAMAYTHLRKSIRWGWPLLISAAASMLVGNMSKIYAFSHLATNEVVAFSFWMRAFSVIQLSHVAACSILIGQLYQSAENDIVPNNFLRYLYFIFPPAVLALGMGIFSGLIAPSLLPPIAPLSAAILFSYFILWCLGAYFEMYITRNGQNTFLLKASLIASAVYLTAVMVCKPSSILQLGSIMAITALIYSGQIFYRLKYPK